MNRDSREILSVKFMAMLDSYFIELYEKGETRTVHEMAEELGCISTTSIYRYIKYCACDIDKATIFKCMMCTTKFNKSGSHADYYKSQGKYLEKYEESQKRKNAALIAKKLYDRQQSNKKIK